MAKLAYANKTKQSRSPPRNLALGNFGELPIVFSTKVNLLYLLYSTSRRYCLLHLIKQNCSLKTFLRTLILMTQVSLYLFSLLELIWNYIIFQGWEIYLFFGKLSLTFWRFLYDFPWLQASKLYDSPWLSWENIYLFLTYVLELKLEETTLTWKWFINLGNNLIATKKKINSGEKNKSISFEVA